MSRADKIEFEGEVEKALPATRFEVSIEAGGNKKIITCTISGKLRQNFIRIVPGDKVTVEISPYDLTKGIITWRHK